MNRRLEGKIALITGAASGIGRASALRFAAEGAAVVVNHFRTPDRAEEVAEKCRREGVKAEALQADVSDGDQVDAMFGEALRLFGRLDVLISNAGILSRSASHETAREQFDRVLGVNLRGAFLCSQAALRHFLSRPGGGVILSTTSVHEIIPKPEFTAYAVSKGGLEQMTRTLALEYAGRGIRVNAVGPGAIATPMNSGWVNDAERRAEVESHIPMGRAGQPEEIAAVFAFLASDDASYITGQTIFACGGLTLFPEFRGAWASD